MSHLDKTTGAKDLGASLSGAITQALMQVEGMLPAKVVKVDRTAGRVSVQPMIQMGDTGGNKITRAIVPNVPIMTMGAGGIFASFPVKVGDLGDYEITELKYDIDTHGDNFFYTATGVRL